jgi:hypothetical protein
MKIWKIILKVCLNPLNAQLNPICHLLALLGAHHILDVSRLRVNLFNFFLAILNGQADKHTKLKEIFRRLLLIYMRRNDI